MRFSWMLVLVMAVPACSTIDDGLRKIGIKNKVKREIGPEGSRALDAAERLSKTFEDLTPEQEYYIGRAVAAEVLSRTPVFEDDRAHAYLNRVGQTLATASDRPDAFSGYHFFILDTDETNALAAPGAFIFITRGMLRKCKTEDELAAVLAHEVVHVVERHGMQMVQKSKRVDVLKDIGLAEALRTNDVGRLRRALDEIAAEFAGNILKHGYSRSMEREADEGALALLDTVGYRQRALPELLGRLAAGSREGTSLMDTHDSLAGRKASAEKMIGDAAARLESDKRQRRFDAAMARVRS